LGNSALAQLSTTASVNTVIGAVSVDELCAMRNLNDGIRALAAAAVGALTFVTTSGGDSYAATLVPPIDAYTTDFLYCVYFAAANTSTTPSLNLNTLGAKTITRIDGSALVAGDLNGAHALVYDGTNLGVLNPVKVPVGKLSGTIGLASGGTNADLSATGGTSQVLKQTSSGAAITVGRLAISDLSDGSKVMQSSDASVLFRTGNSVTSSGVVNISFSSPFPTSCDGAVITGAGSSAEFWINARSASGIGVSSSVDGAFFWLAFGH
jgi:hypothetical protein